MKRSHPHMHQDGHHTARERQPGDPHQAAPGCARDCRTDSNLQCQQDRSTAPALPGSEHLNEQRRGSPAVPGTVFRSAHISSLRPAAAALGAQPHRHLPAAPEEDRHRDHMSPGASALDAWRQEEFTTLQQSPSPVQHARSGAEPGGAIEPQSTAADVAPHFQPAQAQNASVRLSPPLADQAEASSFHGSFTNSSSTPQVKFCDLSRSSCWCSPVALSFPDKNGPNDSPFILCGDCLECAFHAALSVPSFDTWIGHSCMYLGTHDCLGVPFSQSTAVTDISPASGVY